MTLQESEILTRLLPLRGAEPTFKLMRECGGSRGSTHSVTATRMDEKGWVERERLPGPTLRPRFGYRITPAGRQALANHMATQRVAHGR